MTIISLKIKIPSSISQSIIFSLIGFSLVEKLNIEYDLFLNLIYVWLATPLIAFILSIFIQILTIVISYISFSEYIIRKYVLPNDLNLKSVRVFKSSKSPNAIWGDSQTLEGINNMDNFVNASVDMICHLKD